MKKIKSEREAGNAEWARGVCSRFRESLIFMLLYLPFLFSKLKKKVYTYKKVEKLYTLTPMISCHVVPSTLLTQIDLKECMLPDERFLYGM